jgi:hypothetical protein
MVFNKFLAEESELEDFKNSCGAYGYKTTDFELSTESAPEKRNEIFPLKGTITIKHKPTDKSKTYKAGHGSKWASEFDEDLKTGFFS